MKRNLIAMCCVAVLACAGTASADVLAEDSAANYTEETFNNGSNLGTGFGAWQFWNAWPKLADSTAGLCGDINSENSLSFRFARDEGADYCNGYRGFDALKPGDVLTFRFTCAWCGGGRGLDLFANGGHEESDKIANVINLSGDNQYSVNGKVIATNWAPQAVSEVTVSQLADGIQIAIKRTSISTDPVVEPLEYTTKVETDKKLTGIGLYAGGWDWSGGADVENYAFYVNDLKIEGEPPTDTLSLAGTWFVAEKEAELSFTLSRQNSEGALEVALASSYPEFASVPELVTIPDGETEVSFTVAATLQGSGNAATISASAEGVAGDTFGIKGPVFRRSVQDDQYQFFPGDSANFWVNWDNIGFDVDLSKVEVTCDPEGSVTLPETLEWTTEDGGAYAASSFTANASGTILFKFDGVQFDDWGVTIREPTFALSGPSPVRVGSTHVYSLYGDFPNESEMVVLSIDGDATIVSVEIDEAPVQDSSSFELFSGKTAKITVEFGDSEAPVTLSAVGDNYSDELPVDVEAAPDYSKFIAYDDASLYSEGFDYAATGAGTDKFQAWTEVYNNNEGDGHRSAGVTLVGSAPDAEALSDDSAFALYANGDAGDAEIRIRRPFVNSLSSGQAFSVQVSPNYRDGAKGVVLQGEWEGNWYDRVEFYCSGDDYAYKLNGGEPVKLPWDYGTKLIGMTLQCAADGSAYTLTFSREGDEDVAVSGLTFEGTVDGALFYSWNGGYGEENNFVFNRLAIEQVEEPIVARNVWLSGNNNPDAAGDYEFTLHATTTDIGVVNLAVSEGATIDPASVDLAGLTEATVTVTLAEAVAGSKITITGTPVDETVDPCSFDIYPIAPYLELKSDNDRWEFSTTDKEIWMYVVASPSNYGDWDLAIDGDEGVLELTVGSVTVPNPDDEFGRAWFNLLIKGEGRATVYLKDFAPDAAGKSWGFTVTKPSVIDLPAPTVVTTASGKKGLAWKAADLAGVALKGSDTLLGEVVWSVLAEGTDYVVEGEGEDETVIVLFDSPVFKGGNVGYITTK